MQNRLLRSIEVTPFTCGDYFSWRIKIWIIPVVADAINGGGNTVKAEPAAKTCDDFAKVSGSESSANAVS
jgi:hypothetical protein